ncbi:pyridoxal-phosphate dependent enzyme [Subsaxibacter sp. CAU 1640]|uniref:1-aminocyclopropane-1-carboxylate deaminase/D-cysteine desulfhydrase n=1 Tax=Subsaxibacter sp. CAU 1640 TaxID=2933271 RepID=UPI00200340BD|nr:pyridoxal-phosphate dependent enzyme [Subsaxibacter sp. CAU 1640]MCK7588987.1 pyridoxal-phosphate dependent enzyme [Subsaxibacter sp. CAU 1640]
MLDTNIFCPIQNKKLFKSNFKDLDLCLKPDYLIHPTISGNKYRKLKYNLEEIKNRNHNTVLTFGGAFSNHISAVAAVGRDFGLNTIGVIRGEELEKNHHDNATLTFAKACGMTLKFISREAYRDKESREYLDSLKHEFGDYYMLPEGGTNSLAIKGCEEILNSEDTMFDYICCSVGTGGTISGLINSSFPHQKIIGFPALKGGFLNKEIHKFATKDNWTLIEDYHFGGYAKINNDLIGFINTFKSHYDIPLDPIYTGKMMYGIFDLMKKGYFPESSKILAIHTGGLQGIEGMNLKLKQKQLPLIR